MNQLGFEGYKRVIPKNSAYKISCLEMPEKKMKAFLINDTPMERTSLNDDILLMRDFTRDFKDNKIHKAPGEIFFNNGKDSLLDDTKHTADLGMHVYHSYVDDQSMEVRIIDKGDFSGYTQDPKKSLSTKFYDFVDDVLKGKISKANPSHKKDFTGLIAGLASLLVGITLIGIEPPNKISCNTPDCTTQEVIEQVNQANIKDVVMNTLGVGLIAGGTGVATKKYLEEKEKLKQNAQADTTAQETLNFRPDLSNSETIPTQLFVRKQKIAKALKVLDFEEKETPSADQMKQRFKELSKKYHPDINHTEEAATRMKEITEAKQILKALDVWK